MAQVHTVCVADKSNQKDDSSEESGDEDKDQSNYFTCLVCMLTARTPRVSFCGHLFCAKCIRNWIRTKGSRAKCPYCQSRIGENTLITISQSRNQERKNSCKSLEDHRRRMLKSSDCVRELAILPEAGMFLRGFIDYPPEPMPRIKPLPPQMLRQMSRRSVRRTYMDHSLHQRAMTFVILLFLFAMYQSGF
ncbi:RING finger protein 151 [Drosophila ficusphila]|uniref:RING finger protein 151 n=1 Tax=Drosophila ficusphila TaxID=30025 RepID=UPI0007E86D70|nr:RING finger protein 151 [Drosophila ficusphila]